MKMKCLATLLLIAVPLLVQAEWTPDQSDDWQVRAFEMLQLIREKEGDESQELIEQAYAYAIFPAVSHTGLILGWASGHGVLIEEGKLTGYVRQRRLSLGFQFGRQSQGQLLLFRDAQTTADFKRGKLEFTPQASLQAGDGRRVAEASFLPRVAVYSLTQDGLMLEAAVGATRFRFTPAEATEDRP